VSEYKLGNHAPGTKLASSLTVEASYVHGDSRTVVLSRPVKGKSPDYYSFDASKDLELPFINAYGSSPQFSYHQSRSSGTIMILPVTGAALLCAEKPPAFGSAKGKFVYQTTDDPHDVGTGAVEFPNHCDPQPRTDLLHMKNPACDVRAYVGGQMACRHMWSLLDADQKIPWADQPNEYHLKFRFWVQPFNESYHTILRDDRWGIASPVEYDVPKCAEGIEGCSKGENGHWVHTIRGTFKRSGRLLAAHFHCHAPTCLEMALYACGPEVKTCNATTGKLLCKENPIYGGSDLHRKADEPGFIAQPPCLWGSDEFGLESPPNVAGLTLHTVKKANATYGHHGEMAWQQMYFF